MLQRVVTVPQRVIDGGRHLVRLLLRREVASPLADYLQWLIRRHQINCVIDVGARQGNFGRLLRRQGFTGTIFSFEPGDPDFQELRRCSEEDGNWLAFPWVLGANNGRRAIEPAPRASTFSLWSPRPLETRTVAAAEPALTRSTVTERRLASILPDITRSILGPSILLSIDADGWVGPVLDGATGCLERFTAIRLRLRSRTEPGGMAAMTELSEHGFVLAAAYPAPSRDWRYHGDVDAILLRSQRQIVEPIMVDPAGSLQMVTSVR